MMIMLTAYIQRGDGEILTTSEPEAITAARGETTTRNQSANKCSSVVPGFRQKMQRRFAMAKIPDDYNSKEAQARFEAALRGAMKTPHKPLSEKPKAKKAAKKTKRSKL